ncbi:protein FAM219A-like [Dysidea avara]|uniref:protein FAM219A-like n=1 Tax=Dysidea avara TaxID=196820 RepID=UPI00332F2662
MDKEENLDNEMTKRPAPIKPDGKITISLNKLHRGPSQLQRQIEHQRNLSRQASLGHDSVQPQKQQRTKHSEHTLSTESSESEDEIFIQSSRRWQSKRDCHQQLIKDGYRLDELSDDETLDLIPPPRTDNTCNACVCTIS